MTRTVQERSGLPGNAENGWPPEPPGFPVRIPRLPEHGAAGPAAGDEFSYLDAGGHVYLDYAGAGLPAQAQLAAHAERMRGRWLGNPHSDNPASAASTELIERARLAVLAHFNAPPEEYAAIFTPNATGAETQAHRRGLSVRPADPADPDAGQSQLPAPDASKARSCRHGQYLLHPNASHGACQQHERDQVGHCDQDVAGPDTGGGGRDNRQH